MMFGQGKLTVAQILDGGCEAFKYVRHSGGFSFDVMRAKHEFMVPEGCEVLSAGSFFVFKQRVTLHRKGSSTLEINPDDNDPERLSKLFGLPCALEPKEDSL